MAKGQALIFDFTDPPPSPRMFMLQIYSASHGWILRVGPFDSGTTPWSSEAGAIEWANKKHKGRPYIVWEIGGVEWKKEEPRDDSRADV